MPKNIMLIYVVDKYVSDYPDKPWNPQNRPQMSQIMHGTPEIGLKWSKFGLETPSLKQTSAVADTHASDGSMYLS